mgnify:CR=1 FL=1
MHTVDSAGWTVGTFNKPRKGLVPFLSGRVLFRSIKDNFFTAKTFQILPNVLAGLGRRQTECRGIVGNLNLTNSVMLPRVLSDFLIWLTNR